MPVTFGQLFSSHPDLVHRLDVGCPAPAPGQLVPLRTAARAGGSGSLATWRPGPSDLGAVGVRCSLVIFSCLQQPIWPLVVVPFLQGCGRLPAVCRLQMMFLMEQNLLHLACLVTARRIGARQAAHRTAALLAQPAAVEAVACGQVAPAGPARVTPLTRVPCPAHPAGWRVQTAPSWQVCTTRGSIGSMVAWAAAYACLSTLFTCACTACAPYRQRPCWSSVLVWSRRAMLVATVVREPPPDPPCCPHAPMHRLCGRVGRRAHC
jgi:hypothetical protein